MLRRLLYITAGLVLMVGLFIFRSPSTAAAGGTIVLRLAHPWPTTSLLHNRQLEPWAKMVSERTNGKVKIEIFPAGTLAKAADIYDGIRSGLFDLGHSYSGYYPGRFPITSVLGLPFLGGSSAEEASLVLWALYEKFPEMRAEYSDVKILTLHSCPAQNLVMAKNAIRKLEDCKGLKLRVPGTAASLAKTLGFAPVVMSNAQTYEAIAKGMVDGCFNSWETLKSFRLVEVTNYVTEANIYWGEFFVAMNLGRWNSLSSEVQKVFEEVGGEWFARFCGKANDAVNIEGKKLFQSTPGKTTITLSKAELENFKTAAGPLVGEWISGLEAKGLPGKAVVKETRKFFEK